MTDSPHPAPPPPTDAARELAILAASREALDRWVTARDWAGYDPRDALRSPLLGRLPGRWTRIAATQLLLRLRFNPRPLLGYGPAHDPKALSLFARAYLRGLAAGDARDSAAALDRLVLVFDHLATRPDVRAEGPFGWGYPFPWQSRHLFVPAHSPNAVCSAYVGEALLELASGEAATGAPPVRTGAAARVPEALRATALRLAAATATYALRLHPRREVGEATVYHYTRHDTNEIFNASLLLGAFLARYAAAREGASDPSAWGEAEARAARTSDAAARHALARDWAGGGIAAECWERAARVARFALERQDADGGWPYGLGSSQRWYDSFHTGYNLLALAALRADLAAARHLATGLPAWRPDGKIDRFLEELDEAISRGYADYRRRFFAPGQPVSYFEGGRGPLDSHAVAHAALTLAAFDDDDAARDQLLLLIAEMEDPGTGHFYYQKRPRRAPNRVAYMRWTQAWVTWALAGVAAFAE